MKKFSVFFLLILFCNIISVEAQNNKSIEYKVTSIDGKAAVKIGGSNWETIKRKTYKLSNTDFIKVDEGLIKWSKNNADNILYETPPISVFSAWNKKPSRSLTTIRGKIRPQGEINKDTITIGFCFVNSDGEWRTNNIIKKDDNLAAMVINQSTSVTLYAYVYWELPNGKIELLDNGESIYTIVPNIDNVIIFKEVIPITSDKSSTIHIFYSKEKKIVAGRWDTRNQLYYAMGNEGFGGGEIDIAIRK